MSLSASADLPRLLDILNRHHDTRVLHRYKMNLITGQHRPPSPPSPTPLQVAAVSRDHMLYIFSHLMAKTWLRPSWAPLGHSRLQYKIDKKKRVSAAKYLLWLTQRAWAWWRPRRRCHWTAQQA